MRILTAAMLVIAFVPALFLLPAVWWNTLCVVLVAACAWEWAALSSLRKTGCLIFAAAIAILGTGFLLPYSGREWCFIAGTIFWALAVPVLLWHKPVEVTSLGRLAMGGIVLVPAFLSLVDLRQNSPALLLAVLAIAWVSDSSAYFTGRAFGRHKLAPAISPGKTWEGLYGGLAAVVAYALVALALFERLITPKWLEGESFQLGIMLIWLSLAVAGILGDLAESWLKRAAGAKDSGNWLPGHGGLLDRVDALLPILPMAALIYSR